MKNNYSKLLPVLFGYFIMGFADVVGISTSYIKFDFELTDTLANLLPAMVFLWFAVFSVPVGLWMNKLGRKKMVLVSMIFTFMAMLIPYFIYSFPIVLVAFAIMGIGNTILQVSLNPLLSNIVKNDQLASSLTFGQFIKTVSSFLGPIIAGLAAGYLGNWKLIFPVYGIITLVSLIWLFFTGIKESPRDTTSSFSACFELLKDNLILILFFGIVFLVGIDVGLNTAVPKFLMERYDMNLDKAGLGNSLYFAARAFGSLMGVVLLMKISGRKFMIYTMILAVIALTNMIFLNSLSGILVMIFIIGLAVANVFSILFSAALQRVPERANEVSGLMIMGVAGGAVIPLLIGLIADISTSQTGGLYVFLVAFGYLLFCGFNIKA